MDYFVCERCGHLNGGHDDTAAFCDALYTDAGGADYAHNYAAGEHAGWEKRRDDIYRPKAAFLLEALSGEQNAPRELAVADFGAGSGYFVGALRAEGVRRVRGYEVSERQVHYANAMLGEPLLATHNSDETVSLAESVSADVVSLIGVLEHLRDPRGVLNGIVENPRVRYLYFSVPLFSLSVFIELAFPHVMPRHLAGGHTHLYTESSINWLVEEFGFQLIAEWWFGTDIVDLYRSIITTIASSESRLSSQAVPVFTELMKPSIDDLQMVLDQRRVSSEVHILLRKAGPPG